MKKDKCVYFWCVEERRDGSKKLTRFFLSYVNKCATRKNLLGDGFLSMDGRIKLGCARCCKEGHLVLFLRLSL
jgi:hypothetical protein